MRANRLPLLLVFTGGCLTGAALLGFWHADAEAVASSQPRRSTGARSAESLELQQGPTAAEPTSSSELVVANEHADPQAAPAEAHTEPTRSAPASQHEETLVGGEPVAEPGSSVADVLVRLEAEYRQGLAPPVAQPEPAPAQPPATAQPAPVAPPASLAAARPAETTTTNALAGAAPPTASAVASPGALPAGAPPAPVAANDARPAANVHIGDVNQNVNLGNVHQGNVYQVPQLAVLQYYQVVNVAGAQPVAPGQPPRRFVAPRASSPTALMNPDNPWGFQFPPTVLVK